MFTRKITAKGTRYYKDDKLNYANDPRADA